MVDCGLTRGIARRGSEEEILHQFNAVSRRKSAGSGVCNGLPSAGKCRSLAGLGMDEREGASNSRSLGFARDDSAVGELGGVV